MRYRKLDANGDYSFGRGLGDFYIDNSAVVAQSIVTRLKLWTGEWFLDVTEGTPWIQEIVGIRAPTTYDAAIRDRILKTNGVLSLESYTSSRNTVTRKLTVTARVKTIFSPDPVPVVVIL